MDLNQYSNYFSLYSNGSQYNRSIGTAYEPGSVIKILTMAAALDAGTVTPQTTFIDTGSIQVGGITIQNWNRDSWGQQDMTGCLQHSLNVCMAWVATQMGPQTFYGYMERFGLGHPTGIDLAGEAMGRLKVQRRSRHKRVWPGGYGHAPANVDGCLGGGQRGQDGDASCVVFHAARRASI
jgi:cell division protein FtsI/penicillin-binding protein 2